MENPIKMDDLGGTTILRDLHVVYHPGKSMAIATPKVLVEKSWLQFHKSPPNLGVVFCFAIYFWECKSTKIPDQME